MSQPATRSLTANRALITVSIMLATIMQAVDTTIANVALPHMQGSMSATSEQIAWVLTSYIVAAAIMTPMTGFLSARMGRKKLFVTAVIGFTLTSMLCGIASSLEEIVLFRILQGVFGAGLVPLSQAVLLDTYPKEKHGQAMAIWGVGVMVGPILGPTLGGYLTEYYNWRWVFLINLPFGILALVGILMFVEETEKVSRRFDMFGFALLSLAIGSLQLMLDRGQGLDWFSSMEIIIESLVAAVCLYMFISHMMTAKEPFLEPGLFKDRNLVLGLVFIFIVGIVLLATLALLPPFLQNLMGFPVITTGEVLAPRGIGSMVSMLIVGRLLTVVDARLLIGAGLMLVSLSLFQMAEFNLNIGPWALIQTGLIQGAGLGLVFVPLSTITFSTLDTRYRTEGTSMFSLIRNIGSSIGISVMVALAARSTQTNHAVIGEQLSPYREPVQRLLEEGGLGSTDQALAILNGELTRQAAAIGYLNDFQLMAWMTLLAIPLLLFFRKQ